MAGQISKDEFIAKYDKCIVILPPMVNLQNENEKVVQELREICTRFNLMIHPVPYHINSSFETSRRILISVADSSGSISPNSLNPNTKEYLFADFIVDYQNYLLEEKRDEEKVIEILSDLKILKPFGKKLIIKKYESWFTPAKAAAEGYIQGSTTNDYSLWWNIYQQRVLFVYSLGVFLIFEK